MSVLFWIVIIAVIILIIGAINTTVVVVDNGGTQPQPSTLSSCEPGRNPDIFTASDEYDRQHNVLVEWEWSGLEPANIAGFTLRRRSGDTQREVVELPANARSYRYSSLSSSPGGPRVHLFDIQTHFLGGCSAPYDTEAAAMIDAARCQLCSGASTPNMNVTVSPGTITIESMTVGTGFTSLAYVLKEGTVVSATNFDERKITTPVEMCGLVGTPPTSYTMVFSGLKENTVYTVGAYAVRGCGSNYAISPTQTVSTPACSIGAVTGNIYASLLTNTRNIRLRWINVNNNAEGSPLTAYVKYGGSTASPTNFDVIVSEQNTIDYTLVDMQPGSYSVVFSAINVCGEQTLRTPLTVVIS